MINRLNSASILRADHGADVKRCGGVEKLGADDRLREKQRTLKLKEPVAAKQITYLQEIAWSQDTLRMGANGLAALTFCEVPIAASKAAR